MEGRAAVTRDAQGLTDSAGAREARGMSKSGDTVRKAHPKKRSGGELPEEEV